MEERPIRVLLVEDNPGDALLIQEMLDGMRDAPFELEHVGYLSAGLERLEAGGIGVVLLDLSLPKSAGLDTFTQVQTRFPQTPIIVLTGLGDETLALQAVRAGAQDYLVKGQVNSHLLVRAMLYAIERERLTAQLQKQNAELEQLYHAYQDMLHFVGHEFSNALNVIGLTSTVLGMQIRDRLDEEELDMLHTLDLTSRRLGALVNNYLSLSRLEEGRLGVRLRDLDLYVDVVSRVLEELQTRIADVRMEVVLDGMEAGHRVMADPNLLAIVYHNLVGNAIKYGSLGGTIRLGLRDEGEIYRLSVWNEGDGIAEEDLSKLFAKFVRLEGGMQEGKRGTGLGLFIAQQLVEKHGGRMWAESQEGSWVDLVFTLPKGDQ